MDNQTDNLNPIQSTPPASSNTPAPGYKPNNFVLYPVLDSLAGWIKFMGIFTIVMGAITCLGIITAAIGVPMILSGISLNKASDNLNLFKNFNSPYTLNEIFTHLNKYFKIQGIFVIIAVVLLILYIAAFLVIFTIISSYTIID